MRAATVVQVAGVVVMVEATGVSLTELSLLVASWSGS